MLAELIGILVFLALLFIASLEDLRALSLPMYMILIFYVYTIAFAIYNFLYVHYIPELSNWVSIIIGSIPLIGAMIMRSLAKADILIIPTILYFISILGFYSAVAFDFILFIQMIAFGLLKKRHVPFMPMLFVAFSLALALQFII